MGLAGGEGFVKCSLAFVNIFLYSSVIPCLRTEHFRGCIGHSVLYGVWENYKLLDSLSLYGVNMIDAASVSSLLPII